MSQIVHNIVSYEKESRLKRACILSNFKLQNNDLIFFRGYTKIHNLHTIPKKKTMSTITPLPRLSNSELLWGEQNTV